LTLQADHSQAMYEPTKEITVPGVITKFVVEPDSWVDLDATENGGIVPWEFDTVSPNSMTRAVWKRDALKVGDTVSIVGNPHKEGKKVACLVRVLMPDGRVLLPGKDPAYPEK
jgi:Family of unknown function (DUF6152)